MKEKETRDVPLPLKEGGLDRRAFLQRSALAGLGLGTALLGGAGCANLRDQVRAATEPTPPTFAPLPADASAAALAVHVLNRVAYGPRPGDVARVAEVGAQGWIEEQLTDNLEEDPGMTWRVNGLDTQQFEESAPDVLDSFPDEQLLTETQQAALLRAIYSRHQLRETLADFWTNHFNIYALKNQGRVLLPTDTERILRPHLLGKFRDLVSASAHSPAMLAYLDNQENKRGVANENYARELLELHTLGVKSGYTQKDIQEVARCFTGWSIWKGFPGHVLQNSAPFVKPYNGFHYDGAAHDQGAKYIPFLDLTIAPRGGQKDGDAVLEKLAAHPATARFLARKLCRRFLGTEPKDVIEQAANAYLQNDTDIRAMLRPILLDGLTDAGKNKPIAKRPLDFVVSSLRAVGADTNGGADVQKHLANMGQPLYQWPMPDGFPEKAAAWTGSLLPRWNFALALVSNTLDGTTVDLNAPLKAAKAQGDEATLNTLMETVYSRSSEATELRSTREQIHRHIETARKASVPNETVLAETTALLLSAPAFQWK